MRCNPIFMAQLPELTKCHLARLRMTSRGPRHQSNLSPCRPRSARLIRIAAGVQIIVLTAVAMSVGLDIRTVG